MFRKRSFSRRPQRARMNSGWTGYNIDQSMTAGTIYVFALWSDSRSDEVNASGTLRCRRILISGDMQHGGAASTSLQAAWYIMTAPTDAAQAVPSALFLDPLSTDTDVFEKRILQCGSFRMVQNSTGGTLAGAIVPVKHFDIDVSPRGRGGRFHAEQDELMFVISTATSDAQLHLLTRTLCAWQ